MIKQLSLTLLLLTPLLIKSAAAPDPTFSATYKVDSKPRKTGIYVTGTAQFLQCPHSGYVDTPESVLANVKRCVEETKRSTSAAADAPIFLTMASQACGIEYPEHREAFIEETVKELKAEFLPLQTLLAENGFTKEREVTESSTNSNGMELVTRKFFFVKRLGGIDDKKNK
jgi:hypothetical protein